MGHSHEHLTESALDGRLWMSLGLNVAITVAEVIGGLMAGSLALLSDAAHNLSDVAALGPTLEPEVIGCGNGQLLGRWDQ